MKSMLIPALLAVGFASHAQNNTMQLASNAQTVEANEYSRIQRRNENHN